MLLTNVKFENHGSSGLEFLGHDVRFDVPGNTVGADAVFVDLPADQVTSISAAVMVRRPAMVITPGATTDDGVEDNMPFKKNNYAATVAPDADNDTADGYVIGSMWTNTTATPREVYQCVDATEGAAVWVNLSLEIAEVHVQGTDQGLDTGGANAVTAAQVKTAVTNSHVSGSDNQSLAALATKVAVDPVPTGKVAVFDATGNIAVATPGLHVADGAAVSGTATEATGFGFVSANEMNTFISGVNGIKDAVNAVIARLEAKGLIAGS